MHIQAHLQLTCVNDRFSRGRETAKTSPTVAKPRRITTLITSFAHKDALSLAKLIAGQCPSNRRRAQKYPRHTAGSEGGKIAALWVLSVAAAHDLSQEQWITPDALAILVIVSECSNHRTA